MLGTLLLCLHMLYRRLDAHIGTPCMQHGNRSSKQSLADMFSDKNVPLVGAGCQHLCQHSQKCECNCRAGTVHQGPAAAKWPGHGHWLTGAYATSGCQQKSMAQVHLLIHPCISFGDLFAPSQDPMQRLRHCAFADLQHDSHAIGCTSS